jgi:hypothetical protein
MNNPQLIRLAIISDQINRKIYPSKLHIAQIISAKKGSYVCMSQLEKDIFAMRHQYDAPIKYSTKKRGYYFDLPEGDDKTEYCFKKALIERLTL